MKSITACPHCSTQFLVDDEQLSQYNGKVRCGNCLNVFNAVDYIVPSSEISETPLSVDDQPSSVETTEIKDQPESEITTSVESALDQISTKVEMEQAYIDKTQSLIENIDIHNITTDIDTIDTQKSSEISELPALDVSNIPDISLVDTIVDTNDDVESVNSFDETAVDDTTENKTETVAFKETHTVSDKLENKDATSDTDEFAYSPNLPSREELSEATEEDLSSEYSVYDLPDEPTFLIDDEGSAPQKNIEDHLIEKNVEPIDAEEVVTEDAEPFYVKEKQPISPLLILLTVIFILVLIGQLVYFLRNTIAQQFPETKPYLQMACEPLGCMIELPKNIQLFSIDDSSIQEDFSHADVIRLTSTITNRAAFNQAFPNLEVTLTDSQDTPKIRRLFKPTEYLPKETNIEQGMLPEDSISIDMPLMTENVKVSGFRILLTY